MLSQGEIRVAALLSACYGMLVDDDIDELYIDKETTEMVNKIRWGLYDLLVPYSSHEAEIAVKGRVIESKLKRDKKDYLISNTQLAMDLLYLAFQPNERGFKKAPSKVIEWYKNNRDTILEISYRSVDSDQFKDSDEGSYLLAHVGIRGFTK